MIEKMQDTHTLDIVVWSLVAATLFVVFVILPTVVSIALDWKILE